MIYLITGNMGTGKTSRAVNMILTNEDGLFTMTLEDGSVVPRPLYFCHIDGLDTKKFNAHELTKEEIQAAPLDELLPTGAVLIVDEAHWTYPVRSAAKAVPEYVQKLSELRHDGFTLILLTQHPSQLDIFVRNLVSKHIHLERKAIGMKQYSWYKCVTNLDNPAALSGTESANWKPPEKAFEYYKSSSQHQKFVKKIPPALYFLIAILGVVAWKTWTVYGIYDKHVNVIPNETKNIQEASEPQFQQSQPYQAVNANGQIGGYNQSLQPAMFMPTIPEKPESKPLYDNVRQVKTFERVAACIKRSKNDCVCYSDQATILPEVSKERCLKYVKDGLPFDPYRDEQQSFQQQPVEQATPAETAQVMTLNSKEGSTQP